MSTGTQIFLGVVIAVVLFALYQAVRRKRPAPRPVTDPGADVLARVRSLAAQDKKIQAIKELREGTGMGLVEAKNYVEALEGTGEPPVPDAGPPEEALAEVRSLAAQGRKIQAIKVLRDHTRLSLKDAKEFVEALDLPGEPWIRRQAPTGELSQETQDRVARLLWEGKKIQAIKIVREETGWGLRESKDYVEGL